MGQCPIVKKKIKMLKIKSLLSIINLLIVCSISAQQVTIFGQEPDYAGREIVFFSFDNYISESEIKLGSSTVAENGDFSVSFQLNDVRLIYTDLDVFLVRFFVEPGFSYHVKLPPFIERLPEERENPFFEKSQVYMQLLNVKNNNGDNIALNEELNLKIINFYQDFNLIHDSLAIGTVHRYPISLLDSIISNYKAALPQTDNRYFDDYAFYRSGLLYFVAQRGGIRHVSNEYFANKPVLQDHHSYMELFNATYENYFMQFGRADNSIFTIINRQSSFNRLRHLLMQDGVLPNDTLSELVILKNIHDEFYADRFSRAALLNILDSVMVYSKIERHKEIASEIRSKTTRLLRGFEPPDFSLYKHDSTLVSLKDYKGKFVYLLFCTTYNYVCLTKYKILEDLHRRHKGWLDIVVISMDDNFKNMIDFRQTSEYQWDFLHFGNQPDVVNHYDVRIFPTAFLIDTEGKIVLSPAPVPMPVFDPDPPPTTNLERILRQELINRRLWHEYVSRGLIVN